MCLTAHDSHDIPNVPGFVWDMNLIVFDTIGKCDGQEYGRHQYESYNPIQPIITWSIVQYWLQYMFIHNIVHDHQINRINLCNQYFTSWTNLLQWPSSLLRKGPLWSTLKWWYIIQRPRWYFRYPCSD